MLLHAAVSLRIEKNTGWKEKEGCGGGGGRRQGGGEKVHGSPQRGEVRGRVMQKENINSVFSLNIDSCVWKVKEAKGGSNAVPSAGALISPPLLLSQPDVFTVCSGGESTQICTKAQDQQWQNAPLLVQHYWKTACVLAGNIQSETCSAEKCMIIHHLTRQQILMHQCSP